MHAWTDIHTYRQTGRQAGKTLLKPGWIDSNFWILGKREGARAGMGRAGRDWVLVLRVRMTGFAGISIARIYTRGVMMAQVSRTCI